MRSNCRFTRGAFLRRLWLFMPLVRMILPLAVTLKRFFAPLWVFIFFPGALGTALSFLLSCFLCYCCGLRLERSHDQDHGPAFHAWRHFNCAMGAELIS